MSRNNILVTMSMVGLCALLGGGCSKEAKKARSLERADAYFAKGAFDSAEIEYANVLRVEPASVRAIRQLGILYSESGSYGRALRFLGRAKELAPEDLEVRRSLASIYLEAKQAEQARSEAVFILAKDPRDDLAPLVLVRCANTTEEVIAVELRLEELVAGGGDSAVLQVAFGILDVIKKDRPGAEARFLKAVALDPASVEAHMSLGNMYWARGAVEEAGESFQTAAELAPFRSKARLRYAEFKIKSENDLEGGIQILTDVTKAAPDYLPALVRLGQMALSQKDYDKCESLVNNILTREARKFDALMLRARLRMVKSEPKKALAELELIARQFATNVPPPLRFEIGLSQLQNNDIVGAMNSLRQALDGDPEMEQAAILLGELHYRRNEPDKAIELAKGIIVRQPQQVQAHQLLANSYVARGRHADAVGVYQKLAEMYPKNPQVPHSMGLVHLQQTNRVAARVAFEKAVELEPRYFLSIIQLVELDMVESRFSEAAARVAKEIENNPKGPEPHFMMGKILLAQNGDQKAAEAEFKKALALDPDYRAAYMALAKMYFSTDPARAVEELRRLVEQNPEDAAARVLIGVVEEARKEYVKAAEAYEEALKLKPEAVVALNNVAYLYSEPLDQLELGYQKAMKAREIDPRDPFVADTLGWIQFKRGEYELALSLIQESAKRLGGMADVQFHLGMTHYMLGNQGAARGELNRAIELKEDFLGRSDADACLAVLAVSAETTSASDIAFLEERLAGHPDDLVALTTLGGCYVRKGAVEKATAAYEKVIKKNPRNAKAMAALARIYFENGGDQKTALDLGSRAHALAGQDSELTYLLGRMAFQSGDYKWSLGLFKEASKGTSRSQEMLYDLGLAHYNVGELAEAEAALRSALQGGTNFARAEAARLLLSMNELFLDPGKAAQQTERVSEVLEQTPGYVPALLVSAVIQEGTGEVAGARAVYEDILKRNALFVPASRRLAILYSRHFGMDREAREQAAKARVVYKTDPELTKILGISAYRLGDVAEARLYLREVAEVMTTDAEAFYYLGLVEKALKNSDGARTALTKSLELNLEPALAKEAERLLGELN